MHFIFDVHVSCHNVECMPFSGWVTVMMMQSEWTRLTWTMFRDRSRTFPIWTCQQPSRWNFIHTRAIRHGNHCIPSSCVEVRLYE